jgi:hypothetical protein
MAKPRLKWYTADQLAKEWEKYSIRQEEINHYLENGQLKRWKRFASSTTDKDVFLEAPPFSWTEDDEDLRLLNGRRDLYVVLDNLKRPDYIMLEEVERFEKEHGLLVDGNMVRSETEKQVDQLIGTTFRTGRKEIMEALKVASWDTVVSYRDDRGLIIVTNPAGKPETTDEEIARWRTSKKKK